VRVGDLAERRRRATVRRRGRMIRRALLAADLTGLIVAFALALWIFGPGAGWPNRFGPNGEILVFVAVLPVWLVAAKIYGLYDQDEERTDHSTADDLVPVFHMITVGLWSLLTFAWLIGAEPEFPKALTFWVLAVVFVTTARVIARRICRREAAYVQNTIIAGAGDVGCRVARKLLRHSEYGLNLLGFVDRAPATDRWTREQVPLLGDPSELSALVGAFDVERVIVAFSGVSDEDVVQLVHVLKELEVQIDVVPRPFEVVGPGIKVHTVEGLPLIGLPPSRLPRSSMLIKRTIDLIGAVVLLVLSAPLFAYIALRIKRDSPGPVLYRQRRLGMNMREFTVLKFRTMRNDAGEESHRRYIIQIMDHDAAAIEGGLYKLERHDDVTRVGRFLRRTSLDELPQLVNVLKGEMSLVGPRPCLSYEVEHFEQHHFERFLVPPGMTGLWQVLARNRSTFVEALEMDVAYVRGWSLGLDLWLLARTPRQLLAPNGTR
jgi:exopolysaccharide biosynthesis polyprenyl glycosylphosphotransferase